MNLKLKVEQLLEAEPKARERVNKDRAIAHLLLQLHPEIGITKDKLMELVHEADSLNRYWRLITADRPELRGKDYDTKRIVEERAQIKYGYEPQYFKDISQKILSQ